MELTAAESIHEVPVLRVGGDVDLRTADALREAVERMLAHCTGLMVIDLTDVTFLDSAGLRVFDDMQRLAGESDATIALVCPQRRIVKLLEITGLDQRFAIHTTTEGAVDPATDDA